VGSATGATTALIAAGLGLQASYHPHLGSLVQAPDQLDKLMPLSIARLDLRLFVNAVYSDYQPEFMPLIITGFNH
jgi:hypothetical protein